MPVEEKERIALHEKLIDTLGAEQAGTLMQHLPPVHWNELATKDDLSRLGTELRAEMQAGSGFVLTLWLSILVPMIA